MAKSKRMGQIEALLKESPDDEELRYGLAMEYIGKGDDKTAAEQLKELTVLDPTKPFIPAFLMCGQVLARLGKDSEAVAILKKGIAAATRNGKPDALHARAEMQALLGTLE